MKYGLIGEKLEHSYSKIIHEKLTANPYDLIPLSRGEFRSFMEKRDFAAINVTIPYKQDVIPYLDFIDPPAEEIGAVNTIVNRSGKLSGYNTDFFGFIYMLQKNGIIIEGRKCLILGNGGTSKTVQTALSHLGAVKILTVSRKPANAAISYEECRQSHTDAQIIVNTTPLGMYPDVDASPLDLFPFTGCEAAIDVIFNPLKTKFVRQAKKLGIKGITGLMMLVAQAKQAEEIFHDIVIEDTAIDNIYNELLNIINDSACPAL